MDENNNNIKDVPYIVFEGELARTERHIKRLWIALIFAIVALLGSNLAWLYYESQFETISYTQDGEGLSLNKLIVQLLEEDMKKSPT